MYNSNGSSRDFREISQYIEGHDVFNSSLLRKLNDPSLVKVKYMITKYEYRPDLIAQDIYGSTEYCGLLMAQCHISVDSYTRGFVLNIIPKDVLDNIIMSI